MSSKQSKAYAVSLALTVCLVLGGCPNGILTPPLPVGVTPATATLADWNESAVAVAFIAYNQLHRTLARLMDDQVLTYSQGELIRIQLMEAKESLNTARQLTQTDLVGSKEAFDLARLLLSTVQQAMEGK